MHQVDFIDLKTLNAACQREIIIDEHTLNFYNKIVLNFKRAIL
jgi:hypothetical protein